MKFVKKFDFLHQKNTIALFDDLQWYKTNRKNTFDYLNLDTRFYLYIKERFKIYNSNMFSIVFALTFSLLLPIWELIPLWCLLFLLPSYALIVSKRP